MKRILYFVIGLFFLMPPFINGQTQQAMGPGQRQEAERIASFKIALFTRRLNLTPSEAEKFWPLYNEFDNRRTKLQQERAETIRLINQNEARMSDAELTKSGDRLVALQVEEAALTESLHKKLKEILPPAKVVRVYQAENMFRNQLLNELRENREQRRDQLRLP
jgi:hypothetical protein